MNRKLMLSIFAMVYLLATTVLLMVIHYWLGDGYALVFGFGCITSLVVFTAVQDIVE